MPAFIRLSLSSLLSLLLCLPVLASTEDARVQLQRSMVALEEARSANDRVMALTDVIWALEEGLAALRAGLRISALRRASVEDQLVAEDAEVAALLVVLQRMGRRDVPVALLHPGGPVGAARAGMLLADMIPALNAEAEALRVDLAQLQDLQAEQETATRVLQDGLAAVRVARTALNDAVANRNDLPKRFVNDPVREAILTASADTLSDFAAGLDRVVVDPTSVAAPVAEFRKGALALPVTGQSVTSAARGDGRPGLTVTTEPQAIVRAPAAATVRYAGPLLEYGQVLILEPQEDILLVLAGLGQTFNTAGDVVEAGAPLGLMGQSDPKIGSDRSTDGDGAGARLTEALYIEIRQNNAPEDPTLWFAIDKDG